MNFLDVLLLRHRFRRRGHPWQRRITKLRRMQAQRREMKRAIRAWAALRNRARAPADHMEAISALTKELFDQKDTQ